MNEEQVRQMIREELQAFNAKRTIDVFQYPLQILDGRNIQLGRTTGTIIGTETTQKLGFFNKAPVSQQTMADLAAGGAASDGVARTGVNTLIDVFQAYGLLS